MRSGWSLIQKRVMSNQTLSWRPSLQMPGWMGVASGVLSGITFIGVCSCPKVSAQFQQHITHQGYKQQIAHVKKVISPPSAPRAVVEPGCSCSVRCLPCQTIPGLGASSSVPSSPDGAHNPPVSFSDFHVALITVTPPLSTTPSQFLLLS